jgi:hypothetical protein
MAVEDCSHHLSRLAECLPHVYICGQGYCEVSEVFWEVYCEVFRS